METSIKEKATAIIKTLAHKQTIHQVWKKRRRGRQARMASVADKASLRCHVVSPTSHQNSGEVKDTSHSQFTQFSQYVTTLRRRAIRKEENSEPSVVATRGNLSQKSLGHVFKPGYTAGRKTESILYYDEEIGDTSLGMKLTM
jgi:deoxyribodipyrimidine photolyase